MSLARQILLHLSRSRWLAGQMSRRSFSRRAVRRFMPGETMGEALTAARIQGEAGLGVVLTQLGENLSSLDEAAAVRDHYLMLLEEIQKQRLIVEPSVKLTQLGLDLSENVCREHVLAVAARAEATGTLLWIDMEDSSYVDRTLALYRAVKERYRGVGVCLQSYLRRTPADLESLLPLHPAIRLVKGAYAEPVEVAFAKKEETDRAYLQIGEKLLEMAARKEGLAVFGTHDLELIKQLTETSRRVGAKDGDWQIAMLYGIKAADQLRLAKEGRQVNTLISYGRHWFPWYMRRLAERPANVMFVLKSLFG